MMQAIWGVIARLPVSFWVTAGGCLLSLLYVAVLDHGEAFRAWKNAAEDERGRRLAKLVLLWCIPCVALAAAVFSGAESLATQREAAQQAEAFIATSNRLAAAELKIPKERLLPPEALKRVEEALSGIDRSIGMSVTYPQQQPGRDAG